MPSFDRPADPDLAPSPWVVRFSRLIRPGGAVLDLACGHGRHVRYLARLGHPVLAADIDVSGLVAGLAASGLAASAPADPGRSPAIEIAAVDLEAGQWPFPDRRFAGIVVTNYLHRPHFRWLPEALDENGVLIFETFGAGNEQLGRPRNPDFLLAPGELLAALGDRLQVVAYEHGLEHEPRPAVRQRLCAIRRGTPVDLPAA